ncbi:MAG TPA: bifunctional indole-3-glycerol phosphate synthase/phosphoribosylanthranilate isomerase [Sediminispirochaeta sp.]|nr:bifunctional indole-3-glycerol phosphate synthase/phosphoribosylanthranilate isomerase [Sediminispirochaeta sp.]
MNILQEIADQRRRDIDSIGHSQGLELPKHRSSPLAKLPAEPFLIAEIKRRSPSAGSIAAVPGPLRQAEVYLQGGAAAVSVLTEETHFGGSLRDLLRLKERFPESFFLRKDFLLDEEDILVSHQTGADGVLLIVAILDDRRLEALYRTAVGLGMEVLVEVHTQEELARAAKLKPRLLGINSRDLRDFSVDLLQPLRLKNRIDWAPRLVFESGIRSAEDAAIAYAAGFDALLVGETLMRRPTLLSEIRDARSYHRSDRFWSTLGSRSDSRPLVKICGLTRREDVEAAEQLGANLLGFVCAPSPRRVSADFIRRIGPTRAPKVAVVVSEGPRAQLPPEVAQLLAEAAIDAVQFHGNESPESCFDAAFPYYKALRLKSTESIAALKKYRSPRVLVDAYVPDAYGGSGKRIDPELLEAAAAVGPLWVAGGIGPENVAEIIHRYRPELIDLSSSLESKPGEKDREKIRRFMDAVRDADSRITV